MRGEGGVCPGPRTNEWPMLLGGPHANMGMPDAVMPDDASSLPQSLLSLTALPRGVHARRKPTEKPTRKQLMQAYEVLYARIPRHPTADSLAGAFADKEIRVLMSLNGMKINDLDPSTGRYVEKTKFQKIVSLLPTIVSAPPAHSPLHVSSEITLDHMFRVFSSAHADYSKSAQAAGGLHENNQAYRQEAL